MADLRNKIVLVTGASSGIGASTAVAFARQGARLHLVARRNELLLRIQAKCQEAGATEVLVSVLDLSLEEDCKQAVRLTVDHYRGLDVLANSVGSFLTGDILELNTSDFDTLMNINARSALILTQESLPHLAKTKGNIVHVSSVAGIRSNANALIYCMTKAALDQMIKCSALRAAKSGVRVNGASPGVVKTNCFQAAGMDEQVEKVLMDRCAKTHPIGRVGQPEEIAGSIVFLASSAASFITGQCLLIDGGNSIMPPDAL